MSKKDKKNFDWMVNRKTGAEMNGYGTEMCLKPVPCDPDTGARIVVEAGKRKGELKEYTMKTMQAQKLSIIWMWPGHRIGTLLKLLRDDFLSGSARHDVTALRSVVAGKAPSTTYASSEGWARDIVKQEDGKYKAQAKEVARKKKLRKGGGNGKVSNSRPASKGSTDSSEGRGQQELHVDEGKPKGRRRRSVSSGRDTVRPVKTKKRVDSKGPKKRTRKPRREN